MPCAYAAQHLTMSCKRVKSLSLRESMLRAILSINSTCSSLFPSPCPQAWSYEGQRAKGGGYRSAAATARPNNAKGNYVPVTLFAVRFPDVAIYQGRDIQACGLYYLPLTPRKAPPALTKRYLLRPCWRRITPTISAQHRVAQQHKGAGRSILTTTPSKGYDRSLRHWMEKQSRRCRYARKLRKFPKPCIRGNH